MNSGRLTVILLSVLVAGVAFILATRYELVEESDVRYVGYSEPAADNPYYAATRVLEDLGAVVRLSRNADVLRRLESDATLLLPAGRIWMRTDEQTALLDWVKSGGRLVFALEELEVDPLLSGLSLSATPVPTPRTYAASFSVSDELTLQADLGAVAEEFDFSSKRSRYAASWRINGDYALVAMEMDYWEGSVVVLSTASFMTNDLLEEKDNAFVFWWIATDNGSRNGITLLKLDRYPSLLRLAMQNGWRVVMAGALILAAVVWGAAMRLGPVLSDSTEVRRSLKEHLQASGWFLWRTRQAQALVDACRWAADSSIESALRPPQARGPTPKLEAPPPDQTAQSPAERSNSDLLRPSHRDQEASLTYTERELIQISRKLQRNRGQQ